MATQDLEIRGFRGFHSWIKDQKPLRKVGLKKSSKFMLPEQKSRFPLNPLGVTEVGEVFFMTPEIFK